MPFLARRVKGALWAKAREADAWKRPNYPYELLSDLIDKHGAGISVWEVASTRDPALKRIAAALTAGNKSTPGSEISDIEFRFVDKEAIEKLGCSIVTNLGDTKDAEINKLHRDIVGLTGPQAVSLLRMMNRKAKLFPARHVAQYLSDSFRRGRLTEDALNQKLLWSLHQKKAVKILTPK
jgi:hypothetical protein